MGLSDTLRISAIKFCAMTGVANASQISTASSPMMTPVFGSPSAV